MRQPADGASEQMIRALCPSLLVFFRHHLPSSRRDTAEDLAQETLLAIWRAFEDGRALEVKDLGAYALGIARNKLKDAHRREYRHPMISLDAPGVSGFLDCVEAAIAEQRLLEAERRELLERSVRRLEPLECEILRLRVVDGVGNNEASRRLGIDPAEGSRVKYRAVARLRFTMRSRREKPGVTMRMGGSA